MSDVDPRWPSRTAAYDRHRTRMMAYGRWQPYVDAGPARDHVTWLRSLGIGWQHIADLAGVPRGSVSRLLYGDRRTAPSKRIRPETERRLLAVRPDPALIPPRTRIDGTGTRRRLRALVAVGWSLNELTKRAGVGALNKTARGDGPVYAGTAAAIRRLYDGLWDVAPPMDSPRRRVAAARARRFAAERGWPPPMAWKEDRIDDPHGNVDRSARAAMRREGREDAA